MLVVTAEQMRRIEKRAIETYGIPGLLLMENAALAVVREIQEYFSRVSTGDHRRASRVFYEPAGKDKLDRHKVVVLCGKGNNGGDGLAVARHLLLYGMDVTVFLFASPEQLQGDAGVNFRLFQGADGKFFVIEGEQQRRLARLALAQAEVVVDAIYGTGLRGALPSLVEEYIEEVNRSPGWVIAVDIPSGVETDSGRVYRNAILAQTTVTFGLPKLGHFLGEGPECCGRVIVDPISIPYRYLADEGVANIILTDDYVRALIPARQLRGHKGSHGKGVLVAGSQGMSGAAVLAGKAALRSGIGLLQIITASGIAGMVDATVTESTVWPAPGENCLDERAWPVIAGHCEHAQALAIGPGLGQNPAFIQVLADVLSNIELPVLLDADALNLVAAHPELLSVRKGVGPLILTPHPGEMARLCQTGPAEVQANRMEYVVNKAVEWEAIIVLKGSVTIVAAPDGRAFLNPSGNPGLGTGGTGDVLTGTILAWLAQGVPPLAAACLGVYLHGKAADLLAQDYGWSGFTASEVADTIPKVRRQLEI